jgi:hypothetical protein
VRRVGGGAGEACSTSGRRTVRTLQCDGALDWSAKRSDGVGEAVDDWSEKAKAVRLRMH